MPPREKTSGASEPGAIVRKVLRMLQILPEAESGWGVRELAAALSAPKSTVHRLLHVLENEGIVKLDPLTGRFGVGVELQRLAVRIESRMDIRLIAKGLLKDLVAQHDETVVLGVYVPHAHAMTFIDVVECSHPVRYVPELGTVLQMLGASGRSMCAFLPEEELQKLLASHPTPEWVLHGLDSVRTLGYAVSHGERIEGAVGISSPYFDVHGAVAGCLLFTVPQHRYQVGQEELLGPVIRRSAETLTELQGGRWPAANE